MIQGTFQTRAAMEADIKHNVHAPGDVGTAARHVEDDSQMNGKYYQLFRTEVLSAGMDAARVDRILMGIESAGQAISRSADISTPVPVGAR